MSLLRWLLGLVRRPKRARPPRDARGRFVRRFRLEDAEAVMRATYLPVWRDQMFKYNPLFFRLRARRCVRSPGRIAAITLEARKRK